MSDAGKRMRPWPLAGRVLERCGCPFAVSAVLGAVLAPTSAIAQSAGAEVNSISFDLEARYDSNIARSGEARAAARGLEREDIRLSPTVTLDLARNFGRNRATLAGLVSYDFFTRNNQLNRERIALDGGLTVQAGPCEVDSGISFSRRQSDLGTIAFFANAPLINVKNTETVQNYRAELGCGSVYGLRPYVGIGYERGDNSAAIRERADFNATRYSTGVSYVSPTIGEISLFASRRDVNLSGLRLAGNPDSYRQTNYGVSYSRSLGTRLQLSAEVAHSDVNPRGPGGGGFSGLTWNLRGTVIAGTRLRVTAAVGREITNNLSSDATFVVSSPYSLRAMYAVNESLELSGGASITRQRFRYTNAPGLIFLERDRREIYDAGLTYKFARRLRARVSGGYETRSANDAFFDYNSTFAVASIGLQL